MLCTLKYTVRYVNYLSIKPENIQTGKKICNYFNVGRPENYFDVTYKQMNATNRIKEKREERPRGKDSAWFPR